LPRAKPSIQRIVEPVIKPGAVGFVTKGKALASAEPGTLILLLGQGFGKDHDKVTVSFGEKETEILPAPLFSKTQILVSVPPLPAGKVMVSAKVDGSASNPVDFEVEWQTVSSSPPGAPVRKFLTRCEAFVVLLANEIRVADFASATSEHKDQLVRRALDARKSFQAAREKLEHMDEAGGTLIHLMEVKDKKAQEKLMRVGRRSADRTLALFDEIIESSQAIRNLDEVNGRFSRGGSKPEAKVLETAAVWAESSLHIAEAMEGAASTVGESAGGSVPDVSGAGADAILFPGQSFAAHFAAGIALAGSVAKGAAELVKNEGGMELEEVTRRLEKLESKLDKLEREADKSGDKLDSVGGKLDKLEKLDKLDRLDKLDKLDKLDRLEAKADKAEGKLEKFEPKLDKLERLEPKIDKLGPKLDKLDHLEAKLDELGGKADKAQGKLEKVETKLDKLEKLEKLEPKLDKLAPRIDKLEPKIDEIQSNQRKIKEFWQFSPEAWNVTQAVRAGVRLQESSHVASPASRAFSVGSIHVLAPGFMIIKIIVDGISTDVTGKNIITPSNVLVDAGISLIGASHSVQIEFGISYTGPIEFSGEKPQGLGMCTFVEGPDASQTSPTPCP
jgi:hypothetical protein